MSRNKYRVAPKEARTYNGVVYASKAEMLRAQELDLLVKSGDVDWWIGQPTFRLGCPENVYRPDFLVAVWKGKPDNVLKSDGTTAIRKHLYVHAEDIKGVETAKFKRDKKLWARYGPIPLHVRKRNGNGWDTTVIEGADE